MGFLLNTRGDPYPPEAVMQRLRELSPRLGLAWVKGIAGAYWALTEGWKPEDDRWQRVNTGELPPDKAFDILHIFTSDVREGDIAGWVDRRWGPRANVGVKAEDIVAQGRREKAAHRDKLFDAAKDDVEYTGRQMNRHKRMVSAGAEPAAAMVSGATLT